MLYLTTRSRTDPCEARHTLLEDRGKDRGLFVPQSVPRFSPEEIGGLKTMTFGECMASVLNRLFSGDMTGWDVECTIGREALTVRSISHRIYVAELWHNPDMDFSWMVRSLTARILGWAGVADKATDWGTIGVRIGVLFGLYGRLSREGAWDPAHPLDVAVPAGDFSVPMSAWFAREMGLPVGTVICGCDDTNDTWELLNHGEFRGRPDGIDGLERMLGCCLGWQEAQRYRECCGKGRMYSPGPEQLYDLRKAFFAAVVSGKRVESMIPNICRSTGVLMGPGAALGMGALQDFRAITGETRPALILGEQSPERDPDPAGGAVGPESFIVKL